MKPRRTSELLELMQPADVELVGGDAVAGPDVVTDNRNVARGAVFVAIEGERVDGHSFASAAADAGAAAVIATRRTDADLPHLIGEDSVRSLSWLARGVVREARARGLVSLGITGSSGKTSTKDLLAQVLEQAGPTVAPEGSQNNEIGVPLTACRVDDETRFLVSEMGARGIGHIEWLTSLVGLDVAVVLNVGAAHVGEFGSIEQTALAKSELVQGLEPAGWAVLNADDPLVAAMAERTRGRIAWFGDGDRPGGDLRVRAEDVRVDAVSRAGFTLVLEDGSGTRRADVQLGVIGRHQVMNALAAAACGIIAGMSLDEVAGGLSRAVVRSSWRMALGRAASGALILNDSYNANPNSMEAALRTAAEIAAANRETSPEARLVAIVGDMLELGDQAGAMHVGVGQLAADLGFDEVIAVGEFADHVVTGTGGNVARARVAERDEIPDSLTLGPGDVVLVKGSRGVGLERVAESLEEDDK